MVKGVNKTVIEVCDTGNKFFDKVVFYVSPKYSFTSEKRLKRVAGNYITSVSDGHSIKKPLRKRVSNKRIIKIAAAAALLLGALLFVIFKLF